jgi:hypothetical protein
MMRRLGGFLLVALGVVLMIAQGVQASERSTDSFDVLVKALSTRYSVQPKSAPLMWMASLCARGFTHGGVRGLRVVQLDGSAEMPDRAGFEEMVSAKLGGDWSRAVKQWEASGEESLVYMRAEDQRMELIVVNLNHGELALVRMTMNPDQLAKWTKEKNKGAMFQ